MSRRGLKDADGTTHEEHAGKMNVDQPFEWCKDAYEREEQELLCE
jgi:hypothetical protein